MANAYNYKFLCHSCNDINSKPGKKKYILENIKKDFKKFKELTSTLFCQTKQFSNRKWILFRHQYGKILTEKH